MNSGLSSPALAFTVSMAVIRATGSHATGTSAASAVFSAGPPPGDPTGPGDPATLTPELRVTGLERNRAAGTATLTVATNLGGTLRVAGTRKVEAGDPVELDEAGSAELQIIPRSRAAKTLLRTGRIEVNPKILFSTADGAETSVRHEFDLQRG